VFFNLFSQAEPLQQFSLLTEPQTHVFLGGVLRPKIPGRRPRAGEGFLGMGQRAPSLPARESGGSGIRRSPDHKYIYWEPRKRI